jgi:hypothetical protein
MSDTGDSGISEESKVHLARSARLASLAHNLQLTCKVDVYLSMIRKGNRSGFGISGMSYARTWS